MKGREDATLSNDFCPNTQKFQFSPAQKSLWHFSAAYSTEWGERDKKHDQVFF